MIQLSRVGRASPLGPQGIPIPRGVRGNTKTAPVLFLYCSDICYYMLMRRISRMINCIRTGLFCPASQLLQ